MITKPTKTTARATPKTAHTLRVTLRGIEPEVWRRIVVHSEWKLDKVNFVLESAMGWFGDHLHSFVANRVTYVSAQSSIGGFQSSRDERRETTAKLSDVLPTVGSKLRWDYDFGDGWEHDVLCENITRRDVSALYPAVIDGENACPPEDCGGPWGYGNFVGALADPNHPDHEQLSEWFGGPFDPAHFDLAAHDGAVRRKAGSGW